MKREDCKYCSHPTSHHFLKDNGKIIHYWRLVNGKRKYDCMCRHCDEDDTINEPFRMEIDFENGVGK